MTTESYMSRRSYVCDQCYRCKVKCSKERPSCKRCQQANRSCTYSLGLWKGQSRDLQRRQKEKEKKKVESRSTSSLMVSSLEEPPSGCHNSGGQYERMAIGQQASSSPTSGTRSLSQIPTDKGELRTLIFPDEPPLASWADSDIVSSLRQPVGGFPEFHSSDNLTDSRGRQDDSWVSMEIPHDLWSGDMCSNEIWPHHDELMMAGSAAKSDSQLDCLSATPSVSPAKIPHILNHKEMDWNGNTKPTSMQHSHQLPERSFIMDQISREQPEYFPQNCQIIRSTNSRPLNSVPDRVISTLKCDRRQPSQQRRIQHSHPYQSSRPRSHSTESVKDQRKSDHQRPASISINRCVSNSPLPSSTSRETAGLQPTASFSSLADQIIPGTSTRNCGPSSSSTIDSGSTCSCLFSTIFSLESLYIFSGQPMDSANTRVLLDAIRSALSICEQVIICRCCGTCWAGVRCLLVIQEVYYLLESLCPLAQGSSLESCELGRANGLNAEDLDSMTEEERSQNLRNNQRSSTYEWDNTRLVEINQVRGETMRAVMLLAGLEMVQFPVTLREARGELSSRNLLSWKAIASDLSCRLKTLLNINLDKI